eukprot:6200219-Pleurochrysis_carterae.AAC.1
MPMRGNICSSVHAQVSSGMHAGLSKAVLGSAEAILNEQSQNKLQGAYPFVEEDASAYYLGGAARAHEDSNSLYAKENPAI